MFPSNLQGCIFSILLLPRNMNILQHSQYVALLVITPQKTCPKPLLYPDLAKAFNGTGCDSRCPIRENTVKFIGQRAAYNWTGLESWPAVTIAQVPDATERNYIYVLSSKFPEITFRKHWPNVQLCGVWWFVQTNRLIYLYMIGFPPRQILMSHLEWPWLLLTNHVQILKHILFIIKSGIRNLIVIVHTKRTNLCPLYYQRAHLALNS